MLKLTFPFTSEVIYLHLNLSDTDRWISQYFPTDPIYQFDKGTTQHSLNHLGYPEPLTERPMRIGVLHFPTEAGSFAHLHLVAGDEEVQRIMELTVQQTTNLPLPCVLEMSDGINPPIKPALFLMPPRPLQQIEGSEKFWLLTFVDNRYFWWESKYRVTVTGSQSFSSLISTLASFLNISITSSSINSAYQNPSNRFDSWYQPTGILLDATLRYCGLKYAHQLNGNGFAQSFEDAYSDEQTNLLNSQYQNFKLAGGTFEQLDRLMPARIYVIFGKQVCGGYDGEGYVVQVDLDDVRSDLVTLTGQYQTVAGAGNYTIIGDLDAIIPNPACTNPTNLTELLAYARKAAIDWWCWQVFKTDMAFQGILDFNIHAGIECVEWVYQRDQVMTRVMRKRMNDRTLGTYRVSSEGGYLSAFFSPNDFENEKICPPCVQNVYASSGSGGDNGTGEPLDQTIDIVTNVCVSFDSSGQPTITVQKKNFRIPFGMTPTGATTCETNPTDCCNSSGGGGGGGDGILPCCGTELIANRLVLTFAGSTFPDLNGNTDCCPCLTGTSWELFFSNTGYFGPLVNQNGTQDTYPIDCPDVTINGGFIQEGSNGINFNINELCELTGYCPPEPPNSQQFKSSFGGTLDIISCNPFYAEVRVYFPVYTFGYTSPCCPSIAFPTDDNCFNTVIAPSILAIITE